MEKAAQSFSIKVGDKVREIFMSFALLNICTQLVGDPENIGLITLSPMLRKAILEQVLAERDAKGKLLELASIDELDVDFEEVLQLLTWVEEHVLNFTMAALERSVERKGKNDPKLSALAASLIGQASLNSQKSPA